MMAYYSRLCICIICSLFIVADCVYIIGSLRAPVKVTLRCLDHVTQVTWRRLGDVHPMTIGLFTFVSDSRVSSAHDRRTNDWSLVIDDARPTDDGTYQCQINSKDDQTNFYNVHLHVTSTCSLLLCVSC